MNTPLNPFMLLIALGIIFIMALVISNLNKSRNKERQNNLLNELNAAAFQACASKPVVTPDFSSDKNQEEGGISPALVAAITASICMVTGKSAQEFKFTAIKRISGNQPVWGLVGTTDIISTRQRFIERGNR